MSDDAEQADQDAVPGGVFGKLPASRPGTRSPRRESAARSAAKSPQPRKPPKPRPAKQPRPAVKPAAAAPQAPAPESPEPQAPDETGDEQRGGLDDLAWAGVAAVAEAATFGVRLANRALGALRENADRR